MSGDLAFDLVLAACLVWSAGGAVLGRDLHGSVILFIVFGLLMTLAWVRLAAPDIALAEAAIGAGLTGALLLDAAGGGTPTVGRGAPRWLLVTLAGLILALLIGGLSRLGTPASDLPAAVTAALPDSGVSHPVTAVLLNFRGYDTLLEVAVLLAALLGVLGAMRGAPPARLSAVPLLQAVTCVLVPLMILTAGYLLWVGAHRPGGAFQAASVVAAAAVLLALAGTLGGWTRPSIYLRLAIAAGPFIFLLVAVPSLDRAVLLHLPPATAKQSILLIEAGLTVSLGALLAGLFLALLRRAADEPGDEPEES